ATLGVVIGVAILWYPTAYPRGMLVAYFDHARGNYQIMTYGFALLPPLEEERYVLYVRGLRERFGVKTTAVAGCVIDEAFVWYVDGYNSVSRRLLIEDHNADIFEECRRLAREQWEAAHPQD